MEKIALVSKYYEPALWWIENHVKNLFLNLKKQWYIVDLLTVKLKKWVVFNDYPWVKRSTWFNLQIPFGYDIIHLHNFDILPHSIIIMYFYIKNLFSTEKTKIIITPHWGATFSWSDFPITQRVIKYIYRTLIWNLLLKYCVDHVIAVSEEEKNELVEAIWVKKNEKVVLIQNGVEDLAFELQQSNNLINKDIYWDYILFIWRVAPIKNIEFLIRARKWIADTKLLIWWPVEESYRIKLQKYIDGLDLQDNIVFVWPLIEESKYSYMDAARWLILCSFKEWEPVVIKEAIARWIPIYLRDNLIQNSIVTDWINGYVFHSEEDLCKLISIKQDDTHIRKINKKIWQGFRWSIVIKDIISVYNYT